MTKELLTNLYNTEKKSTGEIARQFDVSRGIVLRAMENFGIERRKCTEGRQNDSFVRDIEARIGEPLGSYLWHEYVENKRSRKNIAEQLDISDRAVTIYLNRFNIKVRSPQEATNITFQLEDMPIELTETEKQVLYGSLLGDGALTRKKNWSKNFTFQEGHCLRQQPYLEWKAEQLKRFKPIVRVLNLKKQENRCQLYTSPAPILNELYKKFYGEKKIITLELLNELTPLGLAVWYMDDGSYIEKSCRLYTNCFSYEEHLVMQKYFNEKWNLDVRILKQKGQNLYFYLRFPVKETLKFHNILRTYIHSCMMYKIGV